MATKPAMSEDKAFDIFVSYQWNIKDQVKEIADLLKTNGFRVFIDDSFLKPGDELIPKLGSAIIKSKIFLSFVTIYLFIFIKFI